MNTGREVAPTNKSVRRFGEEELATFENVRWLFRNFSGTADAYTREGDRSFSIMIDENTAEQMRQDGWNPKELKQFNENDPLDFQLKIAVSYKIKAPTIWLLSSRGKTRVPEELVGMLDFASVSKVEVVVSAYNWNVNGKTGKKAYLRTLVATIKEDALERKYADVPEVGFGEETRAPAGELPVGFDESRVLDGGFNDSPY